MIPYRQMDSRVLAITLAGRSTALLRSISLILTHRTRTSPLELLPTIRSLNLASTRITDSGLQQVGRLRRLDWLSLENTGVTDHGLIHLRHLRFLECLNLDKTRIEGPGLNYLRGLDRLNILALRDGPLRDGGLENLTRLPRLWVLYTSGSRITRGC